MEGCGLLEASAVSATCQCSHLTAFAVLIPANVSQTEPDQMGGVYHPNIFLYVVLGCVSALLLLSFLLLVCVGGVQGPSNTVHKNLFFSLFLTTAVFLAAIDRTELRVMMTPPANSLGNCTSWGSHIQWGTFRRGGGGGHFYSGLFYHVLL